MRACPNCGEENPERARFCLACATPLEPAAPPREVRKTVTVVFCDLVGSTALGSRIDPEAVRGLMSRYFRAMRGAIERHGGTVEKYIGDAVMAIFGLPDVHEDDALRALRAAQDMHLALEDLNARLERERGIRIAIRIGVNTGEVVAAQAPVGPGDTLVTGDAVNVAARLQQVAAAGEVIFGATTYRLTRDAVTAEPMPALELKGKDEPQRAYRLLAVARTGEAITRRLDSRLVGREREQRSLEDSFRQTVSDRACHLFTVLGTAGAGKSRLTTEAIRSFEREATVVGGRCLSYGESITFWPLIEVVRQAVSQATDRPRRHAGSRPLRAQQPAKADAEETQATGGRPADDGGDLHAGLLELLEGESEATVVATRILEALGLADPTARKDEIFWAVRRLFETLARRRPLVVVFDDIHWAEPTFLDLIDHVVDWARGEPILIICLARPDLLDRRPAWGGGKLNAASIVLEPLSTEDSASLIENLLGEARLDEAVKRRVVEAAEGNPLFVEQMLAMLIDEGLVRLDDARWVATGDLSRLEVPPTLRALLAARLDQLPPRERAVIGPASVIGGLFYRGAVAELTEGGADSQLTAQLLALVRKELIRPDRSDLSGEDAFRFWHGLIRDAAYESMSKTARAKMHERFADWLQAAVSSHSQEYAEIVGYHLEQAHRCRTELGVIDELTAALGERAGRLLLEAGRRASLRQDLSAATQLLQRGRSLISGDEREGASIDLDIAQTLDSAGEYTAAAEIIERVRQRALTTGDRIVEMRARVLSLGTTHELQSEGFVADGLRTAGEAIDAFEQAGDDAGLAIAWRTKSQLYNMLAQRGAQIEPLERAIVHAKRAGARLQELEYMVHLGASLYWGPTPVPEALARIEALESEIRGHPFHEARLRMMRGSLLGMAGRFDEGRKLLDDGRAALDDLSRRTNVARVAFFYGPFDMYAGHDADAEAKLRVACEMMAKLGDTSTFPSLASLLAEALYRQGRDDEAEAWLIRARDACSADDVEAQAYWRGVLAKVLARRGQVAEAEPMAREAVAIMAKSDEIEQIGDMELYLAEVLAAAGRPDEAVAAASRARDWFAAKGNVPSVASSEAFIAAHRP